MASSPDHLYLDLATINNDNTGGKVKTALNFNELRNNPYLDNPDNYFLGICRFEVDTAGFSLPQFIPVMLIDGVNNNPNVTIYTITMGKNQIVSPVPTPPNPPVILTDCVTVNVLWQPEDLSASFPANLTTTDPLTLNTWLSSQDISSGYYNCYSLKWWINCINNAIQTCWTTLTGSATNSPYLTIQENTNLVSLYTPNVAGSTFSALMNDSSGLYTIPEAPPVPPFSTPTPAVFLNPNINYCMFFNEPMYNLLSSLPSVYYGVRNYNFVQTIFDIQSYQLYLSRPYLFNYYIQPVNYNGINIDAFNYCVTQTNYSPVPMWNPVAQMVFTTSLIPISASLTNVPSAYNTNPFDLAFLNSGNNANVSSMLTDIEVGLTTGSEYKPSILYIPKNEYRLVDLFGGNPINQASLIVSWKTKKGNVIAFKLGAQCGANIKLLFRRKRFNLNNLPPYDTN